MIYKLDGTTPKIDSSVFVAENAVIIGDVVIGRNSSVWFGAVLRGDINAIRIGEFTNIQDLCVCHVPNRRPLNVGNYVTVGHGVVLHCAEVGNNCLIGMGSILMEDSVVGDNAVIGAGSVVTEGTVIPAGVLAFGAPAKVRRELSEGEIEMIRSSAIHYHEIAKRYIGIGCNGPKV